MSKRKDVESYLRTLRRRGAPITVETRSKHLAVVGPDGRVVTILAQTPTGHRWRANLDQALRREGLYPNADRKARRSEERGKQQRVRMTMPEPVQTEAVVPKQHTEPSLPSQEELLRRWEALRARAEAASGQKRGSLKAAVLMLRERGVTALGPSVSATSARLFRAETYPLSDPARVQLANALHKLESLSESEFARALNRVDTDQERGEWGDRITSLLASLELTGKDRFRRLYTIVVGEVGDSEGIAAKRFASTCSNLCRGRTQKPYMQGFRRLIEAGEAMVAAQKQEDPTPSTETTGSWGNASWQYVGPEDFRSLATLPNLTVTTTGSIISNGPAPTPRHMEVLPMVLRAAGVSDSQIDGIVDVIERFRVLHGE